MIFQVISSIIAVYFSCIVFEAPKRLIKFISAIGGLGWFVYLLFLETQGLQIATYFSGLTVAICSHLAARYFKAPVTVFFIPGFFPLVPGAGMYRTVYSFFIGDVEKGQFYFGQTMTTAGMIALAIFTVDSIFRLYSHWQSSRRQSTN